jgi:hypothetical protein
VDFIDFNIEWYKNRLSYYHEMQCKNQISNDIVHEAKILHKFLDDLRDEGYHATYDLFQGELQATERLATFIDLNDEKPFHLKKKAPDYATLIYNQTEKPLSTYLQSLVHQASKMKCDNLKPDEISDFLFNEIFRFTSWVSDSIPSDTAVVL